MFWTIQHKSVIDEIERDGIYRPDFSFSNPNYPGTYSLLLRVADYLNPSYQPLKGLIFTFDDSLAHPLTTLSDVKTFFQGNSTRQHFIDKNLDCRLFCSTEHYILALDELAGFNSMPLDIALFTALSDCVDNNGKFPQFARNDMEASVNQKWNKAVDLWLNGDFFSEWLLPRSPTMKMNILERHLPFITIDQVVLKKRIDKLGIIPRP